MTPTLLLALFGFGLVALVNGSSADAQDELTELPDDEQGLIPAASIIPEEPQAAGPASDIDFIEAGENGDDFVLAAAGDSLVLLGDGNDSMFGFGFNHMGDDTLVGGDGNDVIEDGVGSNQFFGGDGDDTLFGQEDPDTIFQRGVPFGVAEFDQPGGRNEAGFPISEDEARQRLEEISTPDFYHGGAGDDHIFAQDGDTVVGGSGNDAIHLSWRDDTAFDAAIVLIEDFDTQEDVLALSLPDELQNASAPTQGDVQSVGDIIDFDFVEDSEAGGLLALNQGTPIAFLRGLTADDISDISIVGYGEGVY